MNFQTVIPDLNKHLSDCYSNHSMLHNPATQKQSTTLQRVDCNRNINLNRDFSDSNESPIQRSFKELQIKLTEQLTISYSREKGNKAKDNSLIDSGNTYNKILLLSSCFSLEFFFMNSALPHLLKSNRNRTQK